jgi:hypothetical protein
MHTAHVTSTINTAATANSTGTGTTTTTGGAAARFTDGGEWRHYTHPPPRAPERPQRPDDGGPGLLGLLCALVIIVVIVGGGVVVAVLPHAVRPAVNTEVAVRVRVIVVGGSHGCITTGSVTGHGCVCAISRRGRSGCGLAHGLGLRCFPVDV